MWKDESADSGPLFRLSEGFQNGSLNVQKEQTTVCLTPLKHRTYPYTKSRHPKPLYAKGVRA